MSEEARKLFEDAGLTYADVTHNALDDLIELVDQKMQDSQCMRGTLRCNESIKQRFNTDGTLLDAYITCRSHYFSDREAISFNSDEFIGFCGWASSANEAPIIEAFNEWVAQLKEEKTNNDTESKTNEE